MLEQSNERQNMQNNHSISTLSNYNSGFLEVVLNPQKIFNYLVAIILSLVVIHIVGQSYRYIFNEGIENKLIRLFNLDKEFCIPSLYSSCALLLCSILLAIIAKDKKKKQNRYYQHWKYLALIFLYLAVDEGIIIHERSIVKVRNALDLDGFFYYAWIVPAIILFSLFCLVYLKFVRSLPKKTRILFILCAATFVSGAIGVEMIGGKITALQGQGNLTYIFAATIEEFLEMIAIAGYIYSLLDYIKRYVDCKPLIIRF